MASGPSGAAPGGALRRLVSFADLERWDADYYLHAQTLYSAYQMAKLGELMSPVRRVVKKKDYKGEWPVVAKIGFKSGVLRFRPERKTGMDLILVQRGDLLVSSINFHQGAVALNSGKDCVASTHYQTFAVDTARVLPEYLVSALRSAPFLAAVVGTKAKGIKNESGRAFISELEVPLPPLSEQRRLLARRQEQIAAADDCERQAADIERQCLADSLAAVADYNPPPPIDGSARLEFVPFAELDRWEVGYLRKASRLHSVFDGYRYPTTTVGELRSESLFGLSLKATPTPTGDMIPMLRMNNVVNGELDCGNLKYLPRAAVPDRYLLQPGDLLINRTNGSMDLVGKAAVFNNEDTYTYASYLIRYRFDTKRVLPEFVNLMFLLPIVREQIAVLRRQGGGQYNINNEEIGLLRLPLPPLTVQRELAERFAATRKREKELTAKAEQLRRDAAQEFEAALFTRE